MKLGCVCYVFVTSHLRHKLEKKVVRCIFVGYDQQRKGWRCCDPTNGKCYVSRNVVFDETSSWWSTNRGNFLDSETLKENPESSKVNLNLDESETVVEEDNIKYMHNNLGTRVYSIMWRQIPRSL